IQKLVANEGDVTGELGKTRHDLEGQIRESHTQAMLETKFHMLGLEELVPGALWKGTHERVQHAIDEARKNGGRAARDAQWGRWKLEIDGREVQVQEVDSTKAAQTDASQTATEILPNFTARPRPGEPARAAITVADVKAATVDAATILGNHVCVPNLDGSVTV